MHFGPRPLWRRRGEGIAGAIPGATWFAGLPVRNGSGVYKAMGSPGGRFRFLDVL
jgi:hypothetical protein